jgi:hypothetical protein
MELEPRWVDMSPLRRSSQELILRSRRGNTMVLALLLVLIVGVASFSIPQIEATQQKHMRTLRIRSLMTNLETRLRELALNPNTYLGCDSSHGVTSCRVNETRFNRVSILRVFGAECPTGQPSCGLRFQPDAGFPSVILTPNGAQISGLLVYEGLDIKLAPRALAIQVPSDIIQSKIVSCAQIDPTRPIFSGFDSQGRARCRSLPSPCGPGQYLYGVSPASLESQCRIFTPSELECPDDQMISRLIYTNGNMAAQCGSRLDPFQAIPSPDVSP